MVVDPSSRGGSAPHHGSGRSGETGLATVRRLGRTRSAAQGSTRSAWVRRSGDVARTCSGPGRADRRPRPAGPRRLKGTRRARRGPPAGRPRCQGLWRPEQGSLDHGYSRVSSEVSRRARAAGCSRLGLLAQGASRRPDQHQGRSRRGEARCHLGRESLVTARALVELGDAWPEAQPGLLQLEPIAAALECPSCRRRPAGVLPLDLVTRLSRRRARRRLRRWLTSWSCR